MYAIDLVAKKIPIYFGEDKTKCTLFIRERNLPDFNIIYNCNKTKKYHMVEYFSYSLDAKLSGGSMAMKSLRKINTKLQFLCRQNGFLSSELRRLLCNSLIEPHFDYTL